MYETMEIESEGRIFKKFCGERSRSIWVTDDGMMKQRFENPYTSSQEWGNIIIPHWSEDGKCTVFINGKRLNMIQVIAVAWVDIPETISKECCPRAKLKNEFDGVVATNIEWCVHQTLSIAAKEPRSLMAYKLLWETSSVEEVAIMMEIKCTTVWNYIFYVVNNVMTDDDSVPHLLSLCKRLVSPELWNLMFDLHQTHNVILEKKLSELFDYINSEMIHIPDWKIFKFRYEMVKLCRCVLCRFQSLLNILSDSQ